MATQVQFRRGTTSQNNAFTGAQGELTIDTDVWALRIHDGTTVGGRAVPTLTATQTFTNKTMGSGSIWSGNAVGLGYGGTGAALTGVAGAIVYSGGAAMGLSAAGTSGQVLTSGGTSAPTWVNASSLTTGTATNATNASNIAGGSAGYLVYQADTNTTGFIAPGAAGTFLKSTGASTPATWATGDVTIGSTIIALGETSTSLSGLNILTATGTSHWKVPVGTTAQRPGSPATGMIRYNSSQSTYEGYSSGAWSSLGGVKSVDALTYIIAETSAGASNGDLDFYAEDGAGTASTQIGQWNRTNLKDYTGTILGSQTTQNVFNTVATTVNAFGAATALNIGNATSATATIRPGTVVGSNTTQNLWNTTATTVNAFGAATTINIGAATGTATFNNANVIISGNLTVQGATTTSSSQNTGYGDSLVDLHYTNGGVNTSDDSKDIGLVFNYFKTTDKNAYLIWSNSTQALEYYSTATDNGTVISGTLGNFRGAGVIYAGSTSGNITLQAAATAGTNTLTLPAVTDTLVALTASQTLTNKTFTNPTIDNIKLGYTTTATAAGSTTLTVTSSYRQLFTGTTTQTVVLPVTSTLVAGMSYEIENNSTGNITVNSSGGNLVTTVLPGTTTQVLCIGTTLTTAADWDTDFVAWTNTASIQQGSLGIGTAASGTAGQIRATDTITSFYSDDRLKTRTGNIENALEKVLSLDGFHYHANETAVALGYDASQQQVGLSAQQVQAVLPEVIAPAPIDPQYMTLHYERIVPLLVEAIKEQQKQIEELKAKLGN